MTMALEGIKILDLSRMVPMPYCTMILADLGADVLKIEDPSPLTGRRAEQAGGTQAAPRAMEARSPYGALNRNKRSIGLNLRHKEAQLVFYKLAETADVVTEDFRPGVSERLGVDYEVLSKINPRIICCAITGYGQNGPYRDLVGHDINYISTGGVLSLIGTRDNLPVIPWADLAGGGLHGVIGILTALLAREQTGEGQFVDISRLVKCPSETLP